MYVVEYVPNLRCWCRWRRSGSLAVGVEDAAVTPGAGIVLGARVTGACRRREADDVLAAAVVRGDAIEADVVLGAVLARVDAVGALGADVAHAAVQQCGVLPHARIVCEMGSLV